MPVSYRNNTLLFMRQGVTINFSLSEVAFLVCQSCVRTSWGMYVKGPFPRWDTILLVLRAEARGW